MEKLLSLLEFLAFAVARILQFAYALVRIPIKFIENLVAGIPAIALLVGLFFGIATLLRFIFPILSVNEARYFAIIPAVFVFKQLFLLTPAFTNLWGKMLNPYFNAVRFPRKMLDKLFRIEE